MTQYFEMLAKENTIPIVFVEPEGGFLLADQNIFFEKPEDCFDECDTNRGFHIEDFIEPMQ